jgi:hypothetical protein
MVTDQELGGRKEIIANNSKYVVSNMNKIVLSIIRYTGNVWPKILRTRFSDHVSMNTQSRENVR